MPADCDGAGASDRVTVTRNFTSQLCSVVTRQTVASRSEPRDHHDDSLQDVQESPLTPPPTQQLALVRLPETGRQEGGRCEPETRREKHP